MIGQLIFGSGDRKCHSKLCAHRLQALIKAVVDFPSPDLLRKPLHNQSPGFVWDLCRHAPVGENLDITLELRHKNQHPESAFGVVQIVLKELPARQVARPPMPTRLGIKRRSKTGLRKSSAKTPNKLT